MAPQKIIKVNQIRTLSQAARWQSHIHIAGICVSTQAHIKPPYISINEAIAIRKALANIPLSVTLYQHGSLSPKETASILAEIGADYYEFAPTDFAKPDQLAKELAQLAEINLPKIAMGFFVLKDDLWAIRYNTETYFDKLRENKVTLFQFELESALNPDFKIKKGDLQQTDRLFSRLPVLVADQFKLTLDYPLPSVAGYFFNIACPGSTQSYDGSRCWPESTILKVLMGR